MTNQARKRAEEYALSFYKNTESPDAKEVIKDFLAGHASALEEIGKVEKDGEEYAEQYCKDLGYEDCEGHETFDAVKHGFKVGRIVANTEIATLRAQLEKARELFEEHGNYKMRFYDAELAQAKG